MADHRDASNDLLGRLLGSSAPDIGCEQCFELLDIYVDAELAGEDAERRVPGMRAHLDGCPACAEEYDSLRELMGVTE
jgi:anti-sigma factor RsiW